MDKKKKKTAAKTVPKKSVPEKKAVPVYKNVLYLIPEDVSVMEMQQALSFLPEDSMEIWKEINILEITVENRTITMESLMEDLYEEDQELLENLSMKQLYTCEYAEEDRLLMQKAMQTLLEAFGGKLGSDTDDFQPYLACESL